MSYGRTSAVHETQRNTGFTQLSLTDLTTNTLTVGSAEETILLRLLGARHLRQHLTRSPFPPVVGSSPAAIFCRRDLIHLR